VPEPLAMRSRAQSGGLREAREAFLRADFDECVRILRHKRGAARDFLLARAYLRMRKNAEAERVLRSSRAQGESMWFSLLAAAVARQGGKSAKGLLREALRSARDDEERAEAHYQRAVLYWMDREGDKADELLERIATPSYLGRREELRGIINANRGDYIGALMHLEQAAALAGGDAMLECSALRNASIYARETYMPAVMASVLRRVESIRRTPYIEVNLYHITRAAGWFAAVDGDYAQAMRRFRSLLSFDVDVPWKIFALCDRAYLSLALGEELNGWAIAEEALDLSMDVAWGSYKVGEHTALLYLADIFAVARPLEAQRCWRSYKSMPNADPFLGAFSREPHVEAWEEYTAGLLDKGAGNAASASAHFNRAFSIYRRLGFEWRAVLTLIAQRDVAPDDGRYDQYIETVLRRFPNSWLRRVADHERRRRGPVPVTTIA
jgi:tetratricopeptide (TPR) repeat protein